MKILTLLNENRFRNFSLFWIEWCWSCLKLKSINFWKLFLKFFWIEMILGHPYMTFWFLGVFGVIFEFLTFLKIPFWIIFKHYTLNTFSIWNIFCFLIYSFEASLHYFLYLFNFWFLCVLGVFLTVGIVENITDNMFTS